MSGTCQRAIKNEFDEQISKTHQKPQRTTVILNKPDSQYKPGMICSIGVHKLAIQMN